MASEKIIAATDLEDFDEVDVVEILVEPGDAIEKGQSIVTLESDKAMMEFPSSDAGVIKDVAVKVGDKIKHGDTLFTLTVEEGEPTAQQEVAKAEIKDSAPKQEATQTTAEEVPEASSVQDTIIIATDLEDFDEVDVVEILVAPDDVIEKGQSIVTLESDKAMMEFPSPHAGTVQAVSINVGDKVKQGDVLITLSTVQVTNTVQDAPEKTTNETAPAVVSDIASSNKKPEIQSDFNPDSAYASPAVRKYANELGVNLNEVPGTGDKGRVRKADVQTYVSSKVNTNSNSQIAAEPLPDFTQYGEVEETPLNKLRQISAQRLSYSWQIAPHVTQFDDADVTDLDYARKQLKNELAEQNIKLTMLPFIMKALVKCLAEFPDFNSSINETATALIHKKYFHIGIAVDTPRGLVVPVIKDVDQKKIPELAQELMDISNRARDGKLSPKEMQGGCMSITNVGSFGGQHFTPILNQPEVAILGVSRGRIDLKKVEGEIDERLMLPLSLSYDHRAIDGVAAVKFITSLKNKLNDVWSLML